MYTDLQINLTVPILFRFFHFHSEFTEIQDGYYLTGMNSYFSLFLLSVIDPEHEREKIDHNSRATFSIRQWS